MWSEISTHKYLFDRQEKEIEVLASLTLDDFKAHFERVFFSEETKRIDMELTSEAHKDEQAASYESNKDHEGHKHIKRTIYDQEFLDDFKSKMSFHNDDYVDNFIQRHNEN